MALKGKASGTREMTIVRPDGSQVPTWASAAPVRDDSGELIGAVMTLWDITAIKELDRLRDEFAAVIAHDLRNPIQAIVTQTELLLRSPHGDEVTVPVCAIHRIQRSVNALASMTNDLLDASRIEVRRLSLDLKPTDVEQALREAVERVKARVSPHPVSFNIERPLSPIMADQARFAQLFRSLIENAAQYSAMAAPIVISARNSGRGIIISVKDEGVGIPPDELAHLFDRFHQAKRSREKRSGLGLGLFISKGLAEAHGGRITVESRPGGGSVFSVWLPAVEEAGKVA
jgi:signal transduction histidine kinase